MRPPQNGFARSVIDTAPHSISSGGLRAVWGRNNALVQWLRDDVFVPFHDTCCYGAQMSFGKKVQTSLQPDLRQAKSSAPLPPRAFVLHFQCNYMLNICLSICWIPSICMTRFNAGPAKPNGMTTMPSNHSPGAAGRDFAGGRQGERRREERETNVTNKPPSLDPLPLKGKRTVAFFSLNPESKVLKEIKLKMPDLPCIESVLSPQALFRHMISSILRLKASFSAGANRRSSHQGKQSDAHLQPWFRVTGRPPGPGSGLF